MYHIIPQIYAEQIYKILQDELQYKRDRFVETLTTHTDVELRWDGFYKDKNYGGKFRNQPGWVWTMECYRELESEQINEILKTINEKFAKLYADFENEYPIKDFIIPTSQIINLFINIANYFWTKNKDNKFINEENKVPPVIKELLKKHPYDVKSHNIDLVLKLCGGGLCLLEGPNFNIKSRTPFDWFVENCRSFAIQ